MAIVDDTGVYFDPYDVDINADPYPTYARLREEAYQPIPQHQEIYDQLYREYVILHDYFGRGANDVMKRLKRLREEMRTDSH